MIAILTGVRCDLGVILIYISFTAKVDSDDGQVMERLPGKCEAPSADLSMYLLVICVSSFESCFFFFALAIFFIDIVL
jgi:hypothetical protein